jgi:hypothetical protein
MSRIEAKLSPLMGSEFSLQGAAAGMPGPLRNSTSLGSTAQQVHLVGADNVVKGVLRETSKNSARDGRRFAFSAANAQQESPLPSRVSTLDEAKAFVRKHIAEGQWQHLGQSTASRLTTLSESQLFGSNSKTGSTQASITDSTWKQSETTSTAPDAGATRSQTLPSLTRTATEAERHVSLEQSKTAQKNQHQPEGAATSPDTKTGGVATVQSNALPVQEATQVPTQPVIREIKPRETAHAQPRGDGVQTLFLNHHGEILGEPKAGTTSTAVVEQKRNSRLTAAWVIAVAAANLFLMLALGLYLWGPRPTSSPVRDGPVAGAPASLPAPAGPPSVSLVKADTSPRAAPIQAQKDAYAASSGKRTPRGKRVNHCNGGSASGETDSACPNGRQNVSANEPELRSVPGVTSNSNVNAAARDERTEERGGRTKQIEDVSPE